MDFVRSRFASFRNNEIMLSPSSLESSSSADLLRSSVTSSTDRLPLLQQRSLFRSLSGFARRKTSDVESDEPGSRVRRLTTFSGVFAPVCLSMFSAILFLRLGFAVGQAGFLATLGLFGIAYVIVTCTVFSICAISTNGAVEGGGAYYMISRALGPEFGGGIGVLFFLANICSGALYVSGAVETLTNSFGPGGSYSDGGLSDGQWWKFLYGAAICTLNLAVCIVGSAMFAYMSAFILAIVASWGPDYTNSDKTFVNAATVFAVLFNGVTGIMSGANVAGELKNAARSIPLGTLSAMGTTAVVYSLLVLMISLSCTNDLLKNNYTFMQGIDVWSPTITIGVLAATLSAAMTNLMGASRVLLAVSRDNLFGMILRIFSRTTESGNPIPSVLMSYLLTVAVLLIPSLNQIAVITSVFFLLSYFGNNLACLALELAAAPNWRPKYRFFTWYTALIGMIGCGVMMFIISPLYTAIAFIIAMLLVLGLHLWSPDINWGSISQALIFHQVRKYLLLLDIRKEHVKYWRPQMLLLVSGMEGIATVVDFVNDLKKGGLYVIGHVREDNFENLEIDPLQDDYPRWLEFVDKLKVKAFIELTVARSVREGIHHLVHLSGLGGMKPNTIILGFPRILSSSTLPFATEDILPEYSSNPSISAREYVMILRDCLKMRKNICIARNFRSFDKKFLLKNKNVNIDVWPLDFMRPLQTDNYDTSILFLLQLATILQMTSTWRRRSTLRVFLCHRQHTDNVLKRVKSLNVKLNQLRIKGKVVPVIWDDAMHHVDRVMMGGYQSEQVTAELDPYNLPEGYVHDVQRMLRFHSQGSALTFLSLPSPPSELGRCEAYLNFLDSISALPSPAVLVHGISIVTSTTI